MKKITGKRKKTDADYEELARLEFLAGLYIYDGQIVLPADNINAVIVEAAKKSRSGKLALSGVFVQDHFVLEYEGSSDPHELFLDDNFRFAKIVNVQRNKIVRTRPIFKEWSATVNVLYDDEIVNESQLDEWMVIGGSQVGLCDWRPRYGRFEIIS